MKRERNLQEADDLHSLRGKEVKSDEKNGAEDQSERSGDDVSDNNKRILHPPPHGDQNEEDSPVSDENPPTSSEDLNKEEDRDEENPDDEMDGAGDDQESIQEHGAINENRIISYVLLPQDYPVSMPSERSDLDSSVLNDHCVLSVKPPISLKDSNLHKFKKRAQEPAGNEGQDDDQESSESSSSSKNMLNKNQKALFDVEDKQYEADMLVESVRSACKRFEEVNEKIIEKKINVNEGDEFHELQ